MVISVEVMYGFNRIDFFLLRFVYLLLSLNVLCWVVINVGLLVWYYFWRRFYEEVGYLIFNGRRGIFFWNLGDLMGFFLVFLCFVLITNR